MAEATERERSLGGDRDGHPERLDRRDQRGELIEAEHVARYRWVAPAAKGRRVLDAACGTAYGTAILADAGASEAVGVDRARDVLEAVREEMPAKVRLEGGDLIELPFPDDSFDLVVSFETIEHLEDPEVALDELARVLDENGVLVVSSPNRGVYPPGNPHHVREYRPNELRDSLARRFANVRLVRQHAWLATTVLEDDLLRSGDGSVIEPETRKVAGIEPGEEIFTLAIASDGELPSLGGSMVIGPPLNQRGLTEMTRTLERQAALLSHQEELGARLEEAEQLLADLPELYAARAELHAVKASPVWRLTAPLRGLKGSAERGYPDARRSFKGMLARLLARADRRR